MFLSTRIGVFLFATSSTMLAASGIAFKSDELPHAIKDVGYAAAIALVLDGRCPIDDVRLSLGDGELPPGLRFGMTGIEGTPTAMGVYAFLVRASNSCGSAMREFSLLVTGKPILQVSREQLQVTLRAGDSSRLRETILVSSTWRGLPYSISEPREPWLSARPTEGVTPGDKSSRTGDRLVLEIDGSKLEPGMYRQTIRISSWLASNAPAVEVFVKVFGDK